MNTQPRLLIVDDSKTMRSILSSYATRLNFDVSEAEDGAVALSRLEEDPDFDIILIDWDMPNMNGLQLLTAIKSHPSLDHAKTMMVTSQSAMERVSQALNVGADDYLMKPLDEDMFTDKFRLLGLVP